MVVVGQDGCLAVVGGQAVQRQRDDILGPPTAGDEDLDRGAHSRGGQDAQVVADLPQDLRGQVAAGFAVLGFIGHVAGLRATWLVSPAVGRLIAMIAGKLLVLQPAISQLVADAQTVGLTVDGPDGPGHADRRAVLDLPAATPGPEGRSWQVLNKQIKDIIQKNFQIRVYKLTAPNDQPCPARNAGDARADIRRETAGSP